jgi:hypothetical protein
MHQLEVVILNFFVNNLKKLIFIPDPVGHLTAVWKMPPKPWYSSLALVRPTTKNNPPSASEK